MKSFYRPEFFKKVADKTISYDWTLLATVILLSMGGLAFIASGLSVKGPAVFQLAFQKQLLLGVWIGGVLAFILAKIDYHVWFKHARTLLFLTFLLLGFVGIFALVVDVMTFQKPVSEAAQIRKEVLDFVKISPIRPYQGGGAIRWIRIPGLTFQPSELAKLTLLIFFASTIQKYDAEELTWMKLKRPIYAFILAGFLTLVQPDLGSVLLTFGILITVMWVSKVPFRIVFTIVLIMLLVGLSSVFAVDYRRERITAFLSPSSAQASQIFYVRLAIQNGGMWGKGYGNSEFKQRGMLFESTTDGIISIIGEEMGFVFTSLFLSLYLVFLYRALKIADEAEDPGGKALAVGIGVWIATQAFVNVAGITGLIPLKGLPLPFVSIGGSSILLNYISVGILLNVSSRKSGRTNLKKSANTKRIA
ncbi:MAG: FtsW/RodA/SpoVE family cell cycle protein [Patescibacteria group bacterium]